MLVNVLYILVILNGGPVIMQEFNSLETCDAAAEYIVNRSPPSPRNQNIIARCFRK